MVGNHTHNAAFQSAVASGDEARRNGQLKQAIEIYLQAVNGVETPPASICLRIARCYERLEDRHSACRWALAVVNAGDEFQSWQAAFALLQRCGLDGGIGARRSVRLAVTGSFTTTQLAQALTLAARQVGIAVETYESPYGQYEQEIINPRSPLYEFRPDVVLLAVHERDLRLAQYSEDYEEEISTEVSRWTRLWEAVSEYSKARLIQYNFAVPMESLMGHLGARLPGSRYVMTRAVNARIGECAGNAVSIVDCEYLSALYGKQRWCDPRYWHMAKQAMALEVLPFLARHTAAVMAADVGLTRKCLVLDLDNTLWGGIIGEDGLVGIKLGDGIEGEAFVTFQEYIRGLKNKGVVLAVCSKNNEAEAKEPFEKHPEMRLKLDDIAIFVANWKPKPDNLRTIAKALDLGLDSLVFVDDNPVERAAVRQLLPEVDVVPLPMDPVYYTRALSDYLLFEASSFTPEDAQRADQYRTRAQIMELQASASNLDDFYRNLSMTAVIAPFDDFHLPRIAQLIGKTNQFNLTARRHSMAQLQAFSKNSDCVHFYLRLRDRFTDHGLVSLMIAIRRGEVLEIDTWLMSCRVLGRTVEAAMLQYLCKQAEEMRCRWLQGLYIPTEKNAMSKDVFARFGFELVEESEGSSVWTYDRMITPSITNEFIGVVQSGEGSDESTAST